MVGQTCCQDVTIVEGFVVQQHHYYSRTSIIALRGTSSANSSRPHLFLKYVDFSLEFFNMEMLPLEPNFEFRRVSS